MLTDAPFKVPAALSDLDLVFLRVLDDSSNLLVLLFDSGVLVMLVSDVGFLLNGLSISIECLGIQLIFDFNSAKSFRNRLFQVMVVLAHVGAGCPISNLGQLRIS